MVCAVILFIDFPVMYVIDVKVLCMYSQLMGNS